MNAQFSWLFKILISLERGKVDLLILKSVDINVITDVIPVSGMILLVVMLSMK